MGSLESAVTTYTTFTKKSHHEPTATISPTRPELSASGKNVVITGGGTGIGKSIAVSFAKAGAASVSILGRREDRLVTGSKDIAQAAKEAKKDTKVLYRVTDLVNKANVDESLKSIAAEVGPIHVLVTNAAIFPGFGLLADTSSADGLMAALDINVRGSLHAVQAFIPLSAPAPDGSPATILNVATATHTAPTPMLGMYLVSKAANHKMMDFIAAENPALHVVGFHPGVILSEMSEPAKDMIKQWDSPDLPGHFAVWLASPEARFLKSKFVWVNWDVDELIARKDEIQNSRLLTWLLDGVPM